MTDVNNNRHKKRKEKKKGESIVKETTYILTEMVILSKRTLQRTMHRQVLF